jgi:hypothetical protein
MSARILTISGAAHPKAEVQSVNDAAGLCLFRWLNAGGNVVDSGGSVAKFSPGTPDEHGVYPEASDGTLITAIQSA